MAPQAAQAYCVRHIKLQIRSRYIVVVEIYRIVQIKRIYLRFIASSFVLLGLQLTTG